MGIRHGLYESEASFVTVCLNGKDCSVRLILVYGPQENDSEDKDLFYHDISVQVEMAYLNVDCVIMVGDFSAKLGYDVIPNDLHPMSNNSEQLFELCNKYNLKLMDSSEHSEGMFTRIYKYKQTIEKSVLDYVFISSDLEEYFTSMQIDEEKHFTPWRSLKHGKRYSDHCAIKFCLNMKAFEQKQASQRIKVWSCNDPAGWEKFGKLTEPSTILSDMWQVGHHTEISYQKWQNNLNGMLHLCFKKKRVRCTEGIYNKEIGQFIKERKLLKKQLTNSILKHKKLMKKIKKYDKLIDHKISEFNTNFIKRSAGKTGTIDKQSFWKLKKILAPRNKEIPHSISVRHDSLLTDSTTIKNEYRTEFQYRLRKREIRSDLKWYESFQNRLCQLRIKACKSSVSPNFSLGEVKQAVGELKSSRSADPTGMVREIFKKCGDGLLYSLVEMVNTIKSSKTFPSDWNKIWIRTLNKKKGTFKKLDNYRGIFLVPVLIIIFEKLLKNRISDTLQQNISKFQNGSMKGKGVVDNLFILRGTINHAYYLGKELWLTFYDIEKCLIVYGWKIV